MTRIVEHLDRGVVEDLLIMCEIRGNACAASTLSNRRLLRTPNLNVEVLYTIVASGSRGKGFPGIVLTVSHVIDIRRVPKFALAP